MKIQFFVNLSLFVMSMTAAFAAEELSTDDFIGGPGGLKTKSSAAEVTPPVAAAGLDAKDQKQKKSEAAESAIAPASGAASAGAQSIALNQLLHIVKNGQTNEEKANACYQVGGMYLHGIGIPAPDRDQAISFYQRAVAINGHAEAQKALDVLLPRPAAAAAPAAAQPVVVVVAPPPPAQPVSDQPNTVDRVASELGRVINRGISIRGSKFKFW